MKSKPRELLNEIRMRRSLYNRPDLSLLVVEGETDCRFFRPMLDEKACKLLPVQGKPAAKELIDIAMAENISGVLTIIDPDYDRLLGRLKSHPNIIYYDENDFEMMIIHSSSFDKAMREYLTAEDLAPLLQLTGFSSLRELVLDRAGRIGLLRFLSAKHTWDLSFSELNEYDKEKKENSFKQFVEANTLAIDAEKLLRVVLNASPNPRVSYEKAHEAYEKAIGEMPSWEQYCNGHDATALIAFGLMNGGWTDTNRYTNGDEIGHSLIVRYSDFDATEAFSSLQNWETSNPPYRVMQIAS